MQGETRERWQTLCQQAANEKNPERLMVLIEEINELLLAKENRLQQQRAVHTSST
jgi:hypothetical protein